MKNRLAATAVWGSGAVILTLLVAGAVIFVPRWMTARGPEATTTVESNGFELQIGEIRIVGEPGVAPPGTQVKAKVLDDAPLSGVFASGVSVSSGIDIELGDGLQPKAEITIELPIHGRDDEGLTPVFAVQEHDGKAMTADFDISSSRSHGIIRTKQLSVFGFIQIGLKELQDRFLDLLMELIDLAPVDKPECYREDFELFGTGLTLVPDGEEVAWPCFREGNRPKTEMTLDLKTPGVWLFEADVPLVQHNGTTLDLPSGIIFVLFRDLPGVDSATALAIPKVTSNVTISEVPASLDMTMSLGYTRVWSILSLAASLIPLRDLEGLEHAQCMMDMAASINDAMKTVQGTLGCIAEFAGNAGLIFGLLSTAPAAIVANVDSTMRKKAGTLSATYAVKRRTYSGASGDRGPDAGAGTTRIRTYTPLDSGSRPRLRADVQVDDRTDLPALPVDSQPSPSATRTGTYWLGATADSASACWRHPDDQETVVCLENPWSDETFTRSIEGELPDSPAASDPVLWALELSDGSRWKLRTGGSWAGRSDGWTGAYYCIVNCLPYGDTEQVILANDEYPHGYDYSSKLWSAFVGEIGSDNPAAPEKAAIVEGWFVG